MTATQPNYLSISRRSLDLEDYMDVARRHIAWILGPIYAGVVIATVVAFLLPNIYESKATMQITPAQVSQALVPSAINQELAQRIAQMEGAIESRTSLSNLIQSPNLNLYPVEQKKEPIDDVIENMRKNLHINITSIGGEGGRRASSFDISFMYPNRVKAQATVQALITRFNEENQHAQQSQQTTLKEMFGDEVTAARANMQKTGENLTKFRIENQGRLPEQTTINLAQMNGLQAQLGGANENLNRLGQARVQIETTLQSVKSQLEIAKQLAQDAPGINTPLARQNESLNALNKEIEAQELRLQQYLQHFKEGYPDVRDLRQSLSVLKTHRDQLLEQQEKQKTADDVDAQTKASQKKISPQMQAAIQAYEERINQGTAMLKNNENEQEFRTKERDRLTKEIETYRARLAPSGVEAQLGDLLREQMTATEAYQIALKKQQMAAQNGELINRRAGELLEVLDPPNLPATQKQPNRWLIVGGGVAASFIVGLALAAVQEAKDTSLKNLKDVRAYTNLPVLGSIPLLENTMLVKRKRRVAYLGWSAAVIVGIIAVCSAIAYYYSVTVNT